MTSTYIGYIANRGDIVDLVRYRLVGDGWQPEIRTVRYLRHDDDTITGIDGDDLVIVPRAEWEIALR